SYSAPSGPDRRCDRRRKRAKGHPPGVEVEPAASVGTVRDSGSRTRRAPTGALRNDNSLGGLKVGSRGLAAAAVRLDLEGDLLALAELAHAGALDGGRVDEDVLAAVIRLDEAEALVDVVEFHGPGLH